jgi:pimeloyl-ACP methyl ester carboxylesterase
MGFCVPERKLATRSSKRRYLLAAGTMLAASALYVQWRSRRAERHNPPRGRFINVDGVRLHYVDTEGAKQAVVLIHGNGSMVKELEISGVIDALMPEYRVLAFDRPGFGFSERPRGIAWTPAAQAVLLSNAMRHIGVGSAIVLGHSWGSMVALELALRCRDQVKGLLLLGGFYFPERRRDVALLSIPAIPVLGDLMRHTISPLIAKALSGVALRKTFAPRAVSERFKNRFPVDLALRPSNIRAAVEDLAMLLPAAASLESRYAQITQPTILIAGADDQILNPQRHSVRLQAAIPGSELYLLPNEGHMAHHNAPLTIVQAVNKLAAASASPRATPHIPDKLDKLC